jgi:hypothetical protein
MKYAIFFILFISGCSYPALPKSIYAPILPKVQQSTAVAILQPGMEIHADLPFGNVCVGYLSPFKRYLISDIFDTYVELTHTHSGFINYDDGIFKNYNPKVTIMYLEGYSNYNTIDDFLFSVENYGVRRDADNFAGHRMIAKSRNVRYYYTKDGLRVNYSYEQMGQESGVLEFFAKVSVRQITIGGEKPTNLPGSRDDLIKVTYGKP